MEKRRQRRSCGASLIPRPFYCIALQLSVLAGTQNLRSFACSSINAPTHITTRNLARGVDGGKRALGGFHRLHTMPGREWGELAGLPIWGAGPLVSA